MGGLALLTWQKFPPVPTVVDGVHGQFSSLFPCPPSSYVNFENINEARKQLKMKLKECLIHITQFLFLAISSSCSGAFRQQRLKADFDTVHVLQLPTLCINKTDFRKGPWVYSLLKMGLRSTNVSTCTEWLEAAESQGPVGFVSCWQS